jgi:hypothetical protein
MFNNCGSLTAATTAKNVTTIGGLAFAGCQVLTDLMLPSSLTTVGKAAFGGCLKLAGLRNPDGVSIIPDMIKPKHSRLFRSGSPSL